MKTINKNIEKLSQVAIKVDHAQLEDVIKKFYNAKRALFIWGTMGIGKSDKVRDACRSLAEKLNKKVDEENLKHHSLRHINDPEYFLLIDIRLSQCDPSDLRGIPVWEKEKMATQWLPPTTFPRKGYGIILFDELNLAPPLVQASAYQFILDRSLGEYVVPEGYSVVAAGNRLEDRASVFDMAKPLANRQGHVQLVRPDVESWTTWASKHGVDPRIIGYLNWRQGSIYGFDPNMKEQAFPTPRTWEFASDLIKDIPLTAPRALPDIKLYVGTVVGEGEAVSFVGFLKLRSQLRPIKEYFEKAKTVNLPDKVDLLWALTVSVVEYYKVHNNKKTLLQLVELLKRFSEEYAVFTLKLSYSFDPSIQSKLAKIQPANALAQKLWKFIM
jgi:hypothetical protein